VRRVRRMLRRIWCVMRSITCRGVRCLRRWVGCLCGRVRRRCGLWRGSRSALVFLRVCELRQGECKQNQCEQRDKGMNASVAGLHRGLLLRFSVSQGAYAARTPASRKALLRRTSAVARDIRASEISQPGRSSNPQPQVLFHIHQPCRKINNNPQRNKRAMLKWVPDLKFSASCCGRWRVVHSGTSKRCARTP